MDKSETFLDSLQQLSEIYMEGMDYVEKESEEYWNSLSKEEQLKVFCAVIRRIYQGELVEKRSYRGVLYDLFNFGPEAYSAAQYAGYLAIHNSIEDERNYRYPSKNIVASDNSDISEK